MGLNKYDVAVDNCLVLYGFEKNIHNFGFMNMFINIGFL